MVSTNMRIIASPHAQPTAKAEVAQVDISVARVLSVEVAAPVQHIPPHRTEYILKRRIAIEDAMTNAQLDNEKLRPRAAFGIITGKTELGALSRDEKVFAMTLATDIWLDQGDIGSIYAARRITQRGEGLARLASSAFASAALNNNETAPELMERYLQINAAFMDGPSLLNTYSGLEMRLALEMSAYSGPGLKQHMLDAATNDRVSMEQSHRFIVGTFVFSTGHDWRNPGFRKDIVQELNRVVTERAAIEEGAPMREAKPNSVPDGELSDDVSKDDRQDAIEAITQEHVATITEQRLESLGYHDRSVTFLPHEVSLRALLSSQDEPDPVQREQELQTAINELARLDHELAAKLLVLWPQFQGQAAAE